MKNLKTILFSSLLVLTLFSCSKDDVAEVVEEIEENEEVVEETVTDDTDFEATDWTTETHTKDVDPNFDEVFEDNTVKRLDFELQKLVGKVC